MADLSEIVEQDCTEARLRAVIMLDLERCPSARARAEACGRGRG